MSRIVLPSKDLTKPKKPRKRSRWGSAKIDKADKYFAMWVKHRDGWTCQRCEKTYPEGYRYLQCSHFFGRRKESLRFEPLNADALCAGCHQYFTSNPLEHNQWQFKQKGEEVITKLNILANTVKKKDRKLEAMYWQQRLEEDFNIKV